MLFLVFLSILCKVLCCIAMESSEVIPEVFKPIGSSTRSGNVSYTDLSEYHFTSVEKSFICGEVRQQTNLLEPTWIDITGTITKKSARGLCERYNIPRRTVRDWLIIFDEGFTFHHRAGRPYDIDGEHAEFVVQSLNAQNAKTHGEFVHDLPSILADQKKQTMAANGKRVFDDIDVSMSASQVYAFKKYHNIKDRKPQDLPLARVKALTDVRLTYKIACCIEAFSGHLTPQYKWNCDATTVIIKRDHTDALVCFIPDKGVNSDGGPLNSSKVPNEMNLLIKWLHMCSAAGEASDLAIIAAVPTMPDDVYFVRKVKGLSNSSVVGSGGYLYLCNSRAGNPALWQHYFKNVVIPTLVACHDAHNHKSADGERSRVFFSTDGEACILNEAFTPEILSMFADAHVDYLKGGPSATSKHQPIDISDNFRDFKTGVRMAQKRGTDCCNTTLCANVNAALDELLVEMVSLTFPDDFRAKLVHACEQIVWVLRAKYVTAEKSAEGFIRSGQHIRSAKAGELSVCYEKIMKQSLFECEPEDLAHMLAMKPQVIEEVRRAGRITNEYLDSLGIAVTEGAVSRDQFVLWRQDAQLITHVDTVARYSDYREHRHLRNDPEEAERAKMTKILNKHAIDTAKKEEKAAQKAAEVVRRNALSVEEKKAEDAEKRRLNLEKKIASERAKADKLAHAMEVLGVQQKE